MDAEFRRDRTPVRVRDRFLLAVLPLAAWATSYHPGAEWRRYVRALAGRPAYNGAWILVEHALLYTTIPALAALVAWRWLSRRNLLAPASESFALHDARRTIAAGIAGGLVVSAVAFGFLAATGTALHSPRFDGWAALGNVASNWYEEIVFRGLLLLSLVAATGRRDAGIVLSSIFFAATHTQYPVTLQAMVALNTALMSWLRLWTGSLWTAWITHQVSDMVVDVWFG